MRSFIAPVVVASALAGLVATAAPASASTAATCAANAGVTLKPGISLTASSGTFASVRGGTIACAGTVNGTQVGGKGTLSFSGVYGTSGGDTCQKGAGSGTLTATVPKSAGGTLTIKGPFTFTRAGSVVKVSGTIAGATVAGVLQFSPAPGQTCATTKVTAATVSGTAGLAVA